MAKESCSKPIHLVYGVDAFCGAGLSPGPSPPPPPRSHAHAARRAQSPVGRCERRRAAIARRHGASRAVAPCRHRRAVSLSATAALPRRHARRVRGGRRRCASHPAVGPSSPPPPRGSARGSIRAPPPRRAPSSMRRHLVGARLGLGLGLGLELGLGLRLGLGLELGLGLRLGLRPGPGLEPGW